MNVGDLVVSIVELQSRGGSGSIPANTVLRVFRLPAEDDPKTLAEHDGNIYEVGTGNFLHMSNLWPVAKAMGYTGCPLFWVTGYNRLLEMKHMLYLRDCETHCLTVDEALDVAATHEKRAKQYEGEFGAKLSWTVFSEYMRYAELLERVQLLVTEYQKQSAALGSEY